MDISAELNNVISASIAKVRETTDESTLQQILFLTKNLLFILDKNKSPEYKIAILLEYLEGMQQHITINMETLRLLQGTPTQEIQHAISAEIEKVLLQYVDPELASPALVTFWLQRTCTIQELKSMDTLMLFVDKEQQKKILSYDKAFLQDPRLQLLRKCLSIAD